MPYNKKIRKLRETIAYARAGYFKLIRGFNGEIDLSNLGLDDNDVEYLIAAISSNPDSAAAITRLNLANNYKITMIPNLLKLTNLGRLNLEGTSISDVTYIGLSNFQRYIKPNLMIHLPWNGRRPATLDSAMLKRHFKKIGDISFNGFFHELVAVFSLGELPEVLRYKISSYLVPVHANAFKLNRILSNLRSMFIRPPLALRDAAQDLAAKEKAYIDVYLEHKIVSAKLKMNNFIVANGFKRDNLLLPNKKGNIALALAKAEGDKVIVAAIERILQQQKELKIAQINHNIINGQYDDAAKVAELLKDIELYNFNLSQLQLLCAEANRVQQALVLVALYKYGFNKFEKRFGILGELQFWVVDFWRQRWAYFTGLVSLIPKFDDPNYNHYKENPEFMIGLIFAVTIGFFFVIAYIAFILYFTLGGPLLLWLNSPVFIDLFVPSTISGLLPLLLICVGFLLFWTSVFCIGAPVAVIAETLYAFAHNIINFPNNVKLYYTLAAIKQIYNHQVMDLLIENDMAGIEEWLATTAPNKTILESALSIAKFLPEREEQVALLESYLATHFPKPTWKQWFMSWFKHEKDSVSNTEPKLESVPDTLLDLETGILDKGKPRTFLPSSRPSQRGDWCDILDLETTPAPSVAPERLTNESAGDRRAAP